MGRTGVNDFLVAQRFVKDTLTGAWQETNDLHTSHHPRHEDWRKRDIIRKHNIEKKKLSVCHGFYRVWPYSTSQWGLKTLGTCQGITCVGFVCLLPGSAVQMTIIKWENVHMTLWMFIFLWELHWIHAPSVVPGVVSRLWKQWHCLSNISLWMSLVVCCLHHIQRLNLSSRSWQLN